MNCTAGKDNKHECGICGSSRETLQAADEQESWGMKVKFDWALDGMRCVSYCCYWHDICAAEEVHNTQPTPKSYRKEEGFL